MFPGVEEGPVSFVSGGEKSRVDALRLWEVALCRAWIPFLAWKEPAGPEEHTWVTVSAYVLS